MTSSPRTDDGDRASAVMVGIVFVGLAIVTALLAGSFWILASGGENAGDPTALAVDSTLCAVESTDDATGIGTVTVSIRYRGNGTVDLSDAVIEYSDEHAIAALDVGSHANATAVRLENASGDFAPEIGAASDRTLVVDLTAARGAPLPSGIRGTIDLKVEGATVTSTSVRAPGGLGENASYVDC